MNALPVTLEVVGSGKSTGARWVGANVGLGPRGIMGKHVGL